MYSSSNICITLEQTWDKTLTLEVKSKFPAAILKFDLLGEKQPRGTEIETRTRNRIQRAMVANNLLFLWSAILVRNNTLTTNSPPASKKPPSKGGSSTSYSPVFLHSFAFSTARELRMAAGRAKGVPRFLWDFRNSIISYNMLLSHLFLAKEAWLGGCFWYSLSLLFNWH